MRVTQTLLIGALCATLMSASALAADPIPTAEPQIALPQDNLRGFDWAGPYIGGFAGAFIDPSLIDVRVGAQAGFNLVAAGFLAGLEIQTAVGFRSPGVEFEGYLNARAGALLGDGPLLDRALVYAEAGVGLVSWFNTPSWTIGGGLEIAIGSALTLFGEGKLVFTLPANDQGWVILAGLNWHPGN